METQPFMLTSCKRCDSIIHFVIVFVLVGLAFAYGYNMGDVIGYDRASKYYRARMK